MRLECGSQSAGDGAGRGPPVDDEEGVGASLASGDVADEGCSIRWDSRRELPDHWGGRAMKLRIVTGTVQAGHVEEAARRWEETVGVELAHLPEFRHAFVAGDLEATRFAAVTVWERFPDSPVSRRLLQGFEVRVRDILPGPLAVEEFDLLVEA
jgi:hypothetical protein